MALVPATLDDARRVATWVATAQDAVLFAGPALGFPVDPDGLVASYPSFVLRVGGECVGFGQCWPLDARTARIGRILVDPARRGEGLGRRLVEGLLEVAAAQQPSAAAVTLAVYSQNTAARRLYESLGFVEAGEPTATVVGDQSWTAIQMRRVS